MCRTMIWPYFRELYVFVKPPLKVLLVISIGQLLNSLLQLSDIEIPFYVVNDSLEFLLNIPLEIPPPIHDHRIVIEVQERVSLFKDPLADFRITEIWWWSWWSLHPVYYILHNFLNSIEKMIALQLDI